MRKEYGLKLNLRKTKVMEVMCTSRDFTSYSLYTKLETTK